MCLPFLRWLHRFGRPNGPTFKPNIKDKFRNYMIGFRETGKDTAEVIEQFKDVISKEYIQTVEQELLQIT